MVEIEFLGPINKKNMYYEANDLNDLKNELKKDDDLKEWLKICAVAVNDKIVKSLELPLKDGDKISLLPPVCGG